MATGPPMRRRRGFGTRWISGNAATSTAAGDNQPYVTEWFESQAQRHWTLGQNSVWNANYYFNKVPVYLERPKTRQMNIRTSSMNEGVVPPEEGAG